MSGSQFRWDGPVLSGRLDALVDGDWHIIPAGPAEASPFDRDEWELALCSDEPGCIEVACSVPPAFEPNTFCRIRVLDASDTPALRPIVIILQAGDFSQTYNKYAELTVHQGLPEHLAAKSTLEMTVCREGRFPSIPAPEPVTQPTAAYLAGFVLSPLPFDVRFTFPRSSQDLWASSTVLKKASPYFRAQLESGFRESISEVVRYPGQIARLDTDVGSTWSESDEELDASVAPPARPQTKVHTIEVTDHAFSTYHALIIWIHTGDITFGPLRPASAAAPRSMTSDCPPPAKRAKKDATGTATPSTPPAVSPRSIYRLAHLLELGTLQADVLEAFASSLTVVNAADQLFSPTSVAYDEVRAAAVGFVAKNWDAVAKTEAMTAKLAQVEADEIEGGGLIMVALAKVLAEAGEA